MQLHRTTTTTTKRRTAQSVSRSVSSSSSFFPIKLADASFPSVYVRNVDYARTRAVDADVMMMLLLLHAVSFPLQPSSLFTAGIATPTQSPDESGRQLHYTLIYTTERRDRHVYYFLQGRISPERHQKK